MVLLTAANQLMKEGDWLCESCGDHQFSRNTSCRKCGALKDGTPAADPSKHKLGDWTCPGCSDHQFARNTHCRKCGMGKNGEPGGKSGSQHMLGDWTCLMCNDHQFARNSHCRACGTAKGLSQMAGAVPGGIAGIASMLGMGGGAGGGGAGGGGAVGNCKWCAAGECWTHNCNGMAQGSGGGGGGNAAQLMAIQQQSQVAMIKHLMASKGGGKGKSAKMPGDWNCPGCGDHQFARNESCRKCGTAKPSESAVTNSAPGIIQGHWGVTAKPGDWSCPGCGDHQFARNSECRKCQTPKPDDGSGMEGGAMAGMGGMAGMAGMNPMAAADGAACKWCLQGQCWTHGQIVNPGRSSPY